MSLIFEPATWGIIAATVVTLFVLVKIQLMRCVVFDVKELHNCVKKGVGKPLNEAFEIINAELCKKYPAYVRPWVSRRWLLFNGGGAMGQMYVLCFTWLIIEYNILLLFNTENQYFFVFLL